jgi:hypothetical protein
MNYKDLYILLGEEQYFTREQLVFILGKLNDANFHSFYLQQIMSNDKKKLL